MLLPSLPDLPPSLLPIDPAPADRQRAVGTTTVYPWAPVALVQVVFPDGMVGTGPDLGPAVASGLPAGPRDATVRR